MKDLNKIRELVVKQDEELKNFIYEFLNINNRNDKADKEINIYDLKYSIEEYVNIDKLDEAKKYLELYKDSLGVEYYSILGSIRLKENKLEEALDLFLEGLKLDEYNIDMLYNMGYLNLILGNLKEGISFFNRCSQLTCDNNLINEINLIKQNIIDTLSKKNYTFVVVGNFNRLDFINYILDKKECFIKINKDSSIDSNRIYVDNEDVKNYDIRPDDIKLIIEYIIRKYDNVVLIFADLYEFDNIKEFRNRAKLVYYKNANYYTDRKYFFERSISLFLEKEVCNNVDFITTSSIEFYSYKKIVEKRKNIYFLDRKIDESMTIKNILNEDYSHNNIEYYVNGKDEYEKYLYKLSFVLNNSVEIENSIHYIYDKYNTEDIYNIYVSILLQNKRFYEIVKLCSESKYCKEGYKLEIKFLYSQQEYDLLEFIINISIGNISLADINSDNELGYRLAILNFEGTKYTAAYKKYKEFIENDSDLLRSPLTNRNISYLKYINQEDDYKIYYKKYKDMVNNFKLDI